MSKKGASDMLCVMCRCGRSGKYCGVCGNYLASMEVWDMRCRCGGVVLPEERYCTGCGIMNTMDDIIAYLEERDASK